MTRTRRVAVVTGTRAEYGILVPVMRAIEAAGLDLRVVATGMHLVEEFGATADVIREAGFTIDARVKMADPCDDYGAMVRSIGRGVCGIGAAVEKIDVDAVLVLGDRVEAFAGAIAGAGLHRVVAHVHGGDVTRGGLDESMRHAITKLAHVHFAATANSGRRIIQMGEAPEHVHVVGAPGLDAILHEPRPDRAELERQLGFQLTAPLAIVLQHPVTTAAGEAAQQMTETLEALRSAGCLAVVLYPNSDAGGRRMIDVIRSYSHEPWMRAFPNLARSLFLGLMGEADVLVGNSSCEIIEAPSFGLPAVNIGERQAGRERGANVLDARYDRRAILLAIRRACSPGFRASIRSAPNPYGDGHAGPRIAHVLRDLPISGSFIQKQFRELA